MRRIIVGFLRRFGLSRLARAARAKLFVFIDCFYPPLNLRPSWRAFVPRGVQIDPSGIKKILVIRTDRVGDLIVSTPAIRSLRLGFPSARIDLLVNAYTYELVSGNSHLDSVLILGRDALGNEYDLAVVLHPGYESNRLAFKSGAPLRIGFTGWGGGWFLTHFLPDDRARRMRHEVLTALELVRCIGCPDLSDTRLEVSVSKKGELFAERFFSDNCLTGRVVYMHPGARQEHIRWTKEGFARVAQRLLAEEGVSVILGGSRDEADLIDEIRGLCLKKPIPLVGAGLTELVSVIKRSSLYVGNITGPMHIACALGVKVVAVSGVLNSLDHRRVWGPWGEGHRVISSDIDCEQCHPSECPAFKCLSSISPDAVLAAAKEILCLEKGKA